MSTSTLSLEDLSALRTQAEGGPVAPEVLYRLLAILETWLRQELDLYGGDRVLTDLMVGYIVKAQPIENELEENDEILGYYYVGWGSVLTQDNLLQLNYEVDPEELVRIEDDSIDLTPEKQEIMFNWLHQSLLSGADSVALSNQTLSPCLLVRIQDLDRKSHDNDDQMLMSIQSMEAEVTTFSRGLPDCNSVRLNGYYTQRVPCGGLCKPVPARR